MNPNRIISATLMALLGMILSGCGGGGVSTGAAGSAGGTSSSVVVDLARGTSTADTRETGSSTDLASAISELLLRNALAATQGVMVYLLDADGGLVAQGMTDAAGEAVISVAPGTYYVCSVSSSTDPSTDAGCVSTPVDVVADSVVVVSNVDFNTTSGMTTFGAITTDTVQNEVAAFQDPNNTKKTIVCHKGRITISVGTPAALNGHLAHGDTLGACPTGSSPTTTGAQVSGNSNASHGNSGKSHGNSSS
jgi:hypothetical protein